MFSGRHGNVCNAINETLIGRVHHSYVREMLCWGSNGKGTIRGKNHSLPSRQWQKCLAAEGGADGFDVVSLTICGQFARLTWLRWMWSKKRVCCHGWGDSADISSPLQLFYPRALCVQVACRTENESSTVFLHGTENPDELTILVNKSVLLSN